MRRIGRCLLTHRIRRSSAENRSHGSVLGLKLRRFCDGTRFRYVFY